MKEKSGTHLWMKKSLELTSGRRTVSTLYEEEPGTHPWMKEKPGNHLWMKKSLEFLLVQFLVS
jgi:hypothetical protein